MCACVHSVYSTPLFHPPFPPPPFTLGVGDIYAGRFGGVVAGPRILWRGHRDVICLEAVVSGRRLPKSTEGCIGISFPRRECSGALALVFGQNVAGMRDESSDGASTAEHNTIWNVPAWVRHSLVPARVTRQSEGAEVEDMSYAHMGSIDRCTRTAVRLPYLSRRSRLVVKALREKWESFEFEGCIPTSIGSEVVTLGL